jgi:hypothetical protein
MMTWGVDKRNILIWLELPLATSILFLTLTSRIDLATIIALPNQAICVSQFNCATRLNLAGTSFGVYTGQTFYKGSFSISNVTDDGDVDILFCSWF